MHYFGHYFVKRDQFDFICTNVYAYQRCLQKLGTASLLFNGKGLGYLILNFFDTICNRILLCVKENYSFHWLFLLVLLEYPRYARGPCVQGVSLAIRLVTIGNSQQIRLPSGKYWFLVTLMASKGGGLIQAHLPLVVEILPMENGKSS